MGKAISSLQPSRSLSLGGACCRGFPSVLLTIALLQKTWLNSTFFWFYYAVLCKSYLELGESLGLDVGTLNLQDVESDGLRERAALADGDSVTYRDILETGRDMGRQVLVTLFKTVVLLDVVKIVTTHGNGSLHLH